MSIEEIFQGTAFGEFLITFAVAMLPIIELRGAIPLGVSIGLGPWTSMIAAILGNMLPVPFIILFIRRVFAWMRKKSRRLDNVVGRIVLKAEGKWDKVHKYQFFGLMVLVAIPLPGTGAWTGALIAALIDMRLRNAMVSIFLGVLIAGILVLGITYGFSTIFLA